jgi:hypothetical protein
MSGLWGFYLGLKTDFLYFFASDRYNGIKNRLRTIPPMPCRFNSQYFAIKIP